MAIHLGEPESPAVRAFAPAVFGMMGAKEEYDFVETFIGKPPKASRHGASSADYALGQNPDSVTFLTELPYFFDPRIEDMSEGDMSRREAVLRSVDASEAHVSLLTGLLEPVRHLITPSNPFVKMVDMMVEGSPEQNALRRAWANSDPEFLGPATVASIFDTTLVSRFYECLSLGLAARTCEFELQLVTSPGDTDALEDRKDAALGLLGAQCEELEGKMNYQVIDIKRLVAIQVECGLHVALALARP